MLAHPSPLQPCYPLDMRPWRDIARELARETDRERVKELGLELNRAMEEQLKPDHHQNHPSLFHSEVEE